MSELERYLSCKKNCHFFEAIDRKIDVNIFMDSSFSMPFMQYTKVKTFLKKITRKINLHEQTGVKVCMLIGFYFSPLIFPF